MPKGNPKGYLSEPGSGGGGATGKATLSKTGVKVQLDTPLETAVGGQKDLTKLAYSPEFDVEANAIKEGKASRRIMKNYLQDPVNKATFQFLFTGAVKAPPARENMVDLQNNMTAFAKQFRAEGFENRANKLERIAEITAARLKQFPEGEEVKMGMAYQRAANVKPLKSAGTTPELNDASLAVIDDIFKNSADVSKKVPAAVKPVKSAVKTGKLSPLDESVLGIEDNSATQ